MNRLPLAGIPRGQRRGWRAAAVLGLLLLGSAAPSYAIWDVADTMRQGQWTIYGRRQLGGQLGLPVASGDFNGDGFSDVILTPLNASSGPAADRSRAGEAVIVLSSGSIGGELDLAALNPPALPSGATLIYGARALDFLGTYVTVGDFDGDGYDDALIGAQYGDGADDLRANSGEAVVVWGGPTVGGRTIDLASVQPEDPVTFVYGAEAGDRLGVWVAGGDFDGDGYVDAVIGADQASGPDNARPHAGETYVVYGGAHLRARGAVDLASPDVPVTTIYGIDPEDHSGSTLRTGDLNGDAARDLVIGAGLNRFSASVTENGLPGGHAVVGGDGPLNDRLNAGEAYVVYGLSGFRPPTVDLQNPPASTIVVYGADAGDAYGEELYVGDYDGDGFGDLAIGALSGDGPGNARSNGGETALVLGGPIQPGSRVDLAAPGPGVTLVYGAAAQDISGDTVVLADLDLDGRDELATASPLAAPGARSAAGVFDVLFGTDETLPSVVDLAAPPPGLHLFSVHGAEAGDMLAYSAASGDVDGDGVADLVFNAMGGDGAGNTVPNAGDIYVLSGRHLSAAAGRDPATASPTPSVSVTANPSSTPTQLATATETATQPAAATETGTPTVTASRSATVLPSPTATSTDTAVPTGTPTRSSTPTPTLRPSVTASRTETATSTVTRTPTPNPTATSTRLPGCPGDCDGNAAVTIEELIAGVNIALGSRPAADCPSMDGNQDGMVSVGELVLAVRSALEGCVVPSATRTFSPSPTPSATPTRSVTPSPTGTATPAVGPRILTFAVLRADNSEQAPTGTNEQGVAIYERPFSFGFWLVVEAERGPAGRAVANSTFEEFGCADLEVQVTRPLGDGSPTVCEPLQALEGGVPAFATPVYDDDPASCARYNDFSCRFVDGSGRPSGRRCSDGCVKFETAEFGCVAPATEQQFCALIDAPLGFPPGDTLVTARVRDIDGNPGVPVQIIVRITGQ